MSVTVITAGGAFFGSLVGFFLGPRWGLVGLFLAAVGLGRAAVGLFFPRKIVGKAKKFSRTTLNLEENFFSIQK